MTSIEYASACIAMMSFKGVGPAKIGSLSKQISSRSVSAIEIASEMADVMSMPCDKESLASSVAEAAATINAATRVGCGIVTLMDDAYPRRLRLLKTAPPVLFFRGDLALLERSIAVIGTRSPTTDALNACLDIAEVLTAAGTSICNGLAQGIDQRAVTAKSGYRAAVVGVAAGGIGKALQSTLSEKTATIAEGILAMGGLVVSESLPDRNEDMYTLISACRIQAGISNGLILVQSTADGGSMYTIKSGIEAKCLIAAYLPGNGFAMDSRYAANISMCSSGNLDGLQRSRGRKATRVHTIKANSIAQDTMMFVREAMCDKPPPRVEQIKLL